MVLRKVKILQFWDFMELRKRSYYQFFFDGTFLHEMIKNTKVSKTATFGFRQKKFHRKKSDNTIVSLAPKITKS